MSFPPLSPLLFLFPPFPLLPSDSNMVRRSKAFSRVAIFSSPYSSTAVSKASSSRPSLLFFFLFFYDEHSEEHIVRSTRKMRRSEATSQIRFTADLDIKERNQPQTCYAGYNATSQASKAGGTDGAI